MVDKRLLKALTHKTNAFRDEDDQSSEVIRSHYRLGFAATPDQIIKRISQHPSSLGWRKSRHHPDVPLVTKSSCYEYYWTLLVSPCPPVSFPL